MKPPGLQHRINAGTATQPAQVPRRIGRLAQGQGCRINQLLVNPTPRAYMMQPMMQPGGRPPLARTHDVVQWAGCWKRSACSRQGFRTAHMLARPLTQPGSRWADATRTCSPTFRNVAVHLATACRMMRSGVPSLSGRPWARRMGGGMRTTAEPRAAGAACFVWLSVACPPYNPATNAF